MNVVLHTKWEWPAYMRVWFYIQSGSGQHTCGCGLTYKVGVASIHVNVVLHTKWEWPAYMRVWFYIQSGQHTCGCGLTYKVGVASIHVDVVLHKHGSGQHTCVVVLHAKCVASIHEGVVLHTKWEWPAYM